MLRRRCKTTWKKLKDRFLTRQQLGMNTTRTYLHQWYKSKMLLRVLNNVKSSKVGNCRDWPYRISTFLKHLGQRSFVTEWNVSQFIYDRSRQLPTFKLFRYLGRCGCQPGQLYNLGDPGLRIGRFLTNVT